MKEIKSAEAEPVWKEVAREALKEWGVASAGIELVARGENIVFRVDSDDGERYALRIHRPGYHTRVELDSEQIWTVALKESGIDVPVAVKTAAGRFYAEIPVPGMNDIRHVGLVKWIDGAVLTTLLKDDPERFSLRSTMKQLGRIAARIHNQATGWEPPLGFQRHSLDADGFMGDHPFWGPFWDLPELTPAERDLIQRTRKKIHSSLMDYGKDPRTYSMIHADLHQGNVMVDDDRVTVFDFDDAGFGWHQYELAVALFSVHDHEQAGKLRDVLLESYRSERTIDDSDLELLPMFLLIRALALLGWVHHRPEIDRTEFLPGLIRFACSRAEGVTA